MRLFLSTFLAADKWQFLLNGSADHGRQYGLLYGLVALYVAASWALAGWAGYLDRFSILMYSKPVFVTSIMLAVFFVSAVIIRIMIVDRPRRLTLAIIEELKTKWFTRERLGQGIPLILLFMFFMACFSSMKSMIPVFHAYSWDQTFYEWDKILHLGVDPWRLTHAVLGGDLAIFIVNFLYNLWFPVMFGVLYWQVFTLKDKPLQKRFLLTFYLSWIVNGTLLATWLSSVGPCFYGLLFPEGDNPYAPLMQTLLDADEHFNIYALTAQNMLWETYQSNTLGFGSGISAMPSMHISVAFLLLLFGHHKGAFWRYAFALFFAVIMIGSVHLGWHYALDGYVSIITTWLIWIIVGKFCDEKFAARA